MPYLTPETVPESATCRALLIPESSDWLAIFSGALTELTLKWNWQQAGITVDEALEVVNTVLAGYYDGCLSSGCEQPTGDPVFRINPDTWAIEELVNGEWVAPQGDYALPPTPDRTEATPEERRCLAAANAVNVLQQVYESLADSFAHAVSLEGAINAAIAVIIAAVGSVFGLPIAALIAVFVALMKVVYTTIEFVTADLWDETFTDKLECFFYECSTDTDGVVSFNIQCIINKIGEATDVDWSFASMRLLLQVSYLLNMVGSQTMDAAGATTEIAIADCEDCDTTWCYVVDLSETDGGFEISVDAAAGSYSAAYGWIPTDVTFFGTRTLLKGAWNFPFTLNIIDVDSIIDYHVGTGGGEGYEIYQGDFLNAIYSESMASQTQGDDIHAGNVNMWGTMDSLSIWMMVSKDTWGGSGALKLFQMRGTGAKPTFLEAWGWTECIEE